MKSDRRSPLIREHLEFASYCVYRFRMLYSLGWDRSVEEADFLAESYLGLCLAAEQWNPTRGAFTTYAYRVIRNRLLHMLRQARKTLPARFQFVSLDAPLDDDDECVLLDVLHSPLPRPEETLVRTELTLAVREAVADLPAPERRFVEGRLSGRSVAAVAAELGCRRSGVAALERIALRQLQPYLRCWSEISAG